MTKPSFKFELTVTCTDSEPDLECDVEFLNVSDSEPKLESIELILSSKTFSTNVSLSSCFDEVLLISFCELFVVDSCKIFEVNRISSF